MCPLLACAGAPRDLPSFPTRRSSDLRRNEHGRPGPRQPHCALGADRGVISETVRAGGGANRASRHAARLVLERKKRRDRKSTRLNSSHLVISYAVFCLKKKKTHNSRE